MNFQDAMQALDAGKSICRQKWDKGLFLRRVVSSTGDEVKCFCTSVTHFQYDMEILKSTGWLIEGSSEQFSFIELIPKLLEGKVAKYPEWINSELLFASEDRKKLYLSKLEEFNFVPTFECLTANDWVIIE